MSNQDKIEQFEKMTEADPNNELGFFSLGQAYLEAGRLEDAIQPLKRVVGLNPQFSKAYEVLGRIQIDLGRQENAANTLRTGYLIAAQRGDRMPQEAMARMLGDLGIELPKVEKAAQAEEYTGSDAVHCTRCGKGAKPLAEPPFPGALGKRVAKHTCAACWEEWVGMGTKVINELHLDLTTHSGATAYDKHMLEFLQLGEGGA